MWHGSCKLSAIMDKAKNRVERGRLVVDGEVLTGAEEIRLLRSNMDATAESFNDRFTAAQLLQINRMLVLCEWDVMPDQWSARQVREALKGKPPRFDEQMRPVYG